MKAQSPPCPTTIAPTSAGGWVHGGTINLIVTCGVSTCTLSVDWCYRSVTNYPTPGTTTYQGALIGDITKTGNCDCDDLLFDALHDELSRKVGSKYNLPPCDPEYTPYRVESHAELCWQKTENGYLDCDTDSWCVKICDFCYQYGQVVLNNCSYTYIGDDCDDHPEPWEDDDENCWKVCGGVQ